MRQVNKEFYVVHAVQPNIKSLIIISKLTMCIIVLYRVSTHENAIKWSFQELRTRQFSLEAVNSVVQQLETLI